MKDWNEVVLVPEFNEQGVACYRLAGGDYLNKYYIVSEESYNSQYSFYLKRGTELSTGGKLLQRAYPCA